MLKVVPSEGSTLWACPTGLRRSHDQLQPLFTCGQPLKDVAAMLRLGVVQQTELLTIGSIRQQKLYSRKEATVEVVEVFVPLLDTALLGSNGTDTPHDVVIKYKREAPVPQPPLIEIHTRRQDNCESTSNS